MIKVSNIDSIHGDFSAFSIDNLGNVYLSDNDIITKLSPKLDTLFSTSLKAHFPTFIQAVKNFRVLTFDKERGIVQFFDNTLTPLTSDLNLYDLNMVQPILVCESFNGNSFWAVDAGTLRLLKINEKFKIITEIENLSFLSNTNDWPTQMFEHNDLLYLLTKSNYVMVFDAFGTLINKLPIQANWLSIYQNAILQYKFPEFQFVNRLNLDVEMACKWPMSGIQAFEITSKHLYVLSEKAFYRGMINQSVPAKNN
ncbi:MAG: hypothetical protein AB8B74_09565 [Crocinitomicaceae bacterium]